jgi:hypothetical protein
MTGRANRLTFAATRRIDGHCWPRLRRLYGRLLKQRDGVVRRECSHLVGGEHRAFGYDNVDVLRPNGKRAYVTRVINPAEAAVVLRIYQEFDSGYGFKAVAKRLTLLPALRRCGVCGGSLIVETSPRKRGRIRAAIVPEVRRPRTRDREPDRRGHVRRGLRAAVESFTLNGWRPQGIPTMVESPLLGWRPEFLGWRPEFFEHPVTRQAVWVGSRVVTQRRVSWRHPSGTAACQRPARPQE